ncbi:MAG: enoyl-CoA hydratase, partial [Gammaproteobacteria bacterium]|nr:enoyl-CoA hydratase [Gammaproteobacteria bacterium]
MTDLNVEHHGHVALVEIDRPPNNFFDAPLIHGIADVFEELDQEPDVRALVLASAGKHFCAGANFG